MPIMEIGDNHRSTKDHNGIMGTTRDRTIGASLRTHIRNHRHQEQTQFPATELHSGHSINQYYEI